MTQTALITGAAGDTGRASVRESLALGLKVRALVHSKDKRSAALEKLGAEAVIGDLLEINTVRAAMEGVDSAYFVGRSSPADSRDREFRAGGEGKQAYRRSSILSQRSANRDSPGPCRDSFIAKRCLTGRSFPSFILRPTYFLEWLLYPWQLPHLQKGVLRMPVGKGRHSPSRRMIKVARSRHY